MTPFASQHSQSVAALGEEKLISLIHRWLRDVSPRSPFGIGDDCAVLPATRGPLLITVDPVIHGRHFDDSVSPGDAGAKLFNRNLSDLAAMGGQPTSAVIALLLDRRVSVKWLERFYGGLATAARRHRTTIVGGDIAQADNVLAASLTLLGKPAGSRIVARTGSRPGDWIYVTGILGGSRRSGHHCRFIPRLKEGAWLARQSQVRAMMDVSDGLAKDMHALTPPGALPALVASAIPRRAGANLRAALTDGEDYELLFALAAKADRAGFERRWDRAHPRTRLTCIGRFIRGKKLPKGAIDLSVYRGYEHLRSGVR